jgi:uncharacterized DUF497 family protein
MNLRDFTGFQWDEHNQDKNLVKHNVNWYEAEEIFFNFPLIINPDKKHSDKETRYYALGITDSDRKLFISFAICESLIRVISARDMIKREY